MAAPDLSSEPLTTADTHLREEFVRSAQRLLDRTETVGRRHTLPITTEERVSETLAAHLEEHYLQAGWRNCTIFARAAAPGTPARVEGRSPAPRHAHTYWLSLER